MSKKTTQSFRVDPALEKQMIDFAKIHYEGNVSLLIVNAIKCFLQQESEKATVVPEELINSILFSCNLLMNGLKEEETWNLLQEEVLRECEILNL